MVRKRYMHLTESMLEENPKLGACMAPSLDARQDIAAVGVQTLGQEAIEKAIKEWGQPKSKITHLVVHATSGIDIPGLDYQLTKQLGLPLNIKRFMMYHQGCHAGGTVLRLEKDLAENNEGARVLVISCELFSILSFRGPSDDNPSNLVGMAVVGDGAAALVIGTHPEESVSEFPLFELVSASQAILPVTDRAIQAQLRETDVLKTTFAGIGHEIKDWNSLFWILHPGGQAVLDRIETKLGLNEEKLNASRHVLSEYGNMGSASVLFILNELRKRSIEKGQATTGEGLNLGVLLGYGPGLNVEAVVLRGLPMKKTY
ncbi:hypothetical protein AQUCO_06900031v1 [Aquilegia coerulea]|uniref:Chalcone synthase n=1 Tax=Aquilegia coerulea TaxID=218851 RepID=A0A2G5CB12_AQUCA|nr:hypothetical protein AQUCO_06900031v1 [Aquilegia coerulea]